VEGAPRHRIGIFLGVVQFVFALTWTVYVIFLPSLAVQAGLPKQSVILILLLDQIVFVFADYATGLAADRVSRIVGRLGHFILGLTLLSCVAFLLMPYVAPTGSASLFLGVVIVWAVTSSALRAPPLVLLGKYAPQPTVPWLAALSLFGLGVAAAISPYLTIVLRGFDPRVPFLVSSAALALATAGIMWAERTLARERPVEDVAPAPKPAERTALWFLFAVLLLAVGFQIHFSLNSAALYLRHAAADQLPFLIPVFWIGFNVFMFPASIATERYGGVAVASAGAVVSALAAFGTMIADDLSTLVAFQFLTGAGWGCVLMSAVSAAIAIGHTGREGKLTGGLFSLLALAACVRIAILAAELNKDPPLAATLGWAPVAAWGAGGLILMALIGRYRHVRAAVPA
jgi:MFS family permease